MNKEAAKVLIAKGKEEIKAFNSAFQIPTYICPQCGECRMQQDSTVGLVATCPPILEAVSFVDKIIFGRLHYNKLVSEYKEFKTFYNECAKEVIDFCEKRKLAYHIKKRTID